MRLDDPFHLSLDTLLGTSALLGHELEDRACIRDAQDQGLLEDWQAASSVPLKNPAQQELFCVAPLDVLVTEARGRKRFHFIELNGTGIGGLTNMTAPAVAAVLEGMADMARTHWCPDGLVLVASSGKESDAAPRMNRLIFEKLLYAEALRRGFADRGRPARVTSMPQLAGRGGRLPEGPTVVVGYIKDFLAEVRLERDGGLSLFGRPVTGAVNDRFCLNVVSQFGRRVDLGRFATMNRCFLPGGDKGVAYGLLNEHIRQEPRSAFPSPIRHARAHHRDQLLSTVFKWLNGGRRAVIKPHGTGIGHGIEFFLSPDDPADEIVRRIDRSILDTERYYAIPGGAFPYTVCEFLDTCTVDRPGHPLGGHKYELRIVVYRDGMMLKAFPTIVKFSGRPWDARHPDRASLINNVTSSAEAAQGAGTRHMLPLSNRGTLDLLGLEPRLLGEVCAACTRYVRHVLTRVQEQPERFWLAPAQSGRRPPLRAAA